MPTKTAKELRALQQKAQEASKYFTNEIVQPTIKTDKHITIDFGNNYIIDTNKAYIASKNGNNLEISLENNTNIIFDEYFNNCTTDLSCIVSLPAQDNIYYVTEGNFIGLADGSEIVFFNGDDATLSKISTAKSPLFAESFTEVYYGEGFSTSSIAGVAATGVGIGVAAGTATAAAAAPLLSANTISAIIVLGEIIATNSLVVKFYKNDGTYISDGAFKDNKFNANLGTYKGAGYVSVTDKSAKNGYIDSDDYVDEKTGEEIDLNVMLFAVFNTTGENTKITITPITTIAAQLMGISVSGKLAQNTTLSISEVDATNNNIAQAFGLDNIITNIPTPLVSSMNKKTIVNPDLINANEASINYGKTLAAISGIGDVSDSINILKNGINIDTTGISLKESAKEQLAIGAAKTNAANDNINILDSYINNNNYEGYLNDRIFLSLEKDSGQNPTDSITMFDRVGIFSINNIGNWEYTYDGNNWYTGGGKYFKLPTDANNDQQYNKQDIAVRRTNNIEKHYLLNENGIAILDTSAPNDNYSINTRNTEIQGIVEVTGLSDEFWEYSVDSGATWTQVITQDSSDFFTLEAGNYAVNQIQVRQIDNACNINTVYQKNSSAINVTTALILSDDNGINAKDGRTSNGVINIIGINNDTDWQWSTNAGINWENGAGNTFFTITQTTDISNIKVNINNNVTDFKYYSSVTQIIISEKQNDLSFSFIDNNTTVPVFKIDNLVNSSNWEYSIDGGNNWQIAPDSNGMRNLGLSSTENGFLLNKGFYAVNDIQIKEITIDGDFITKYNAELTINADNHITTSVNNIYGNNGDNQIIANNANNNIYVYDGSNIITGGGGNDNIYAGNGSDTIVYNNINDGNDIIYGFSLLMDNLDLSNLLTYANADDLNNFLTITNNNNNTIINIDANGDNAGTDIQITLNNIVISIEPLADSLILL